MDIVIALAVPAALAVLVGARLIGHCIRMDRARRRFNQRMDAIIERTNRRPHG